MPRSVRTAVAQLGPIALAETREQVVERLIVLLRQAAGAGCGLVVFPELALTTFFPRWYMEDQAEIDAFFEREMPNEATAPLFAEARRLGIGFHLGYAELAQEDGRTRRFNSAIIVAPSGEIIAKYRKIHLPGHADHRPEWPYQHLEKLYFETGNLGFPVWRAFDGIVGMCICNDRRWPETYRVMGLQGVELIMLGYNTPIVSPSAPSHRHLQSFHNDLSLQAGAYQNGTWVAAAAKCGEEEGVYMIGGSCIVAPTGEIVARATTVGDELIFADCDFERCAEIKDDVFNFARHREPQHYGLITETKGAVLPPPETADAQAPARKAG